MAGTKAQPIHAHVYQCDACDQTLGPSTPAQVRGYLNAHVNTARHRNAIRARGQHVNDDAERAELQARINSKVRPVRAWVIG